MHSFFGLEDSGHKIESCDQRHTPGPTNTLKAQAERATGSGRGRSLKETAVRTETWIKFIVFMQMFLLFH